jgi:hypothetical protein
MAPSRASVPRLRQARRFSSSCFSAKMRADRRQLIRSWSVHSSSSDMSFKSNCCMALCDLNRDTYQSTLA